MMEQDRKIVVTELNYHYAIPENLDIERYRRVHQIKLVISQHLLDLKLVPRGNVERLEIFDYKMR
jgi:hypothetical protein